MIDEVGLTEAQIRRQFNPRRANRYAAALRDLPVTEPPPAPNIPIKQDIEAPLTLEEMERAKNKAVRLMVDGMRNMQPQEIIGALKVLDAEIEARKVIEKPTEKEQEKSVEEMRRELAGGKTP